MLNAIIKDNKVYCSRGHHNYKVKDYKGVEVEGSKYTKFIAYCKECGEVFQYCTKMTIDNTEYFDFSEEQEQEIKESEGVK